MTWQLAVDRAPSRWRRTQLRSFLMRSRDKGRPDLPLLSVNLPNGVVLRQDGDGRPAPAEDLWGYQVVRRGDLVMNQLGKPHGALGVSRYDGIISPAYFVARIGDAAVPRFVHHLLRTRTYISEYERRGKYMPPSQFDISWDQFRSIPVALPSVPEQRAIAHFLDTETNRIDALILKKRRMIDLVDERFWRSFVSTVRELNADLAPLRRALRRIIDGPFGSSLTSSHYSDTGARVVRLGNIGFAEFKDEDRAFIPLGYYGTLSRHRIREGDLLIAGLGDSRNHVGRACVAPDLGRAIVKADCYCAEVDNAKADPTFLAMFLSSPAGAHQVALAARGTTRSRINLDIAKEIVVPMPPVDDQVAIVRETNECRRSAANATDRLTRQIGLLEEHRQALITAAVTGELEIPGVAA